MENSNNGKNDWSKRDVGALWKRESATQKYLSGYVKVDELGIERELKVIVFSNKNKKDNPKAPDYRIYLSLPKEDKTSEAVAKTAPKGAALGKPKKALSKVEELAEEGEEIL